MLEVNVLTITPEGSFVFRVATGEDDDSRSPGLLRSEKFVSGGLDAR